jgi:hypothetical protein
MISAYDLVPPAADVARRAYYPMKAHANVPPMNSSAVMESRQAPLRPLWKPAALALPRVAAKVASSQ